ncbi:MAG TPA: M48 family metallopeptidase [Thermoanaerobaculia bacterium]|nr:M48 family metallopeptidase [Thermoanaerobaculia bacterium]
MSARAVAPLAVLAGLLFLAAPFSVSAQPVPPAPAETTAAPAATAADNGPVAVPIPSEKAMRYYESGILVWWVELLWGFAVPLLLLFSGVSARIRTFAQGIGKRWFPTVAIYFALFAILTFLLDLPLAYFTGFVREHAYGLSNQTAAKWWSDAGKGLLVGIIGSAVVLWIPYLLLKKSPRRWWLWTSLASIPLLALLLVISPIWLDPLFNKFGPMKDKALEGKILALADRAGIEGSRVFEVDKSVDTEKVNAYVAGLGSTKRVVLWDTIIKKLDEREILFVMGHEMGHYVLGHVALSIGLGFLVILIGLYSIHRLARGMIARWGDRFGFHELSDVASWPLIILLFTAVGFVLTPAILAVGREVEHRADVFGLEITRDNHAAATAFVKLQEQNLSNPRPGLLYKLWNSSHPTLGDRIDFCNEYRPWEKGEPLRYGRLIRPAS